MLEFVELGPIGEFTKNGQRGRKFFLNWGHDRLRRLAQDEEKRERSKEERGDDGGWVAHDVI